MAEDADTGDLNAQTQRAAQSARARAEAAMKAAQAAADAADLAEAAAREAQAAMDDWTPVPDVEEPVEIKDEPAPTAAPASPASDEAAGVDPDVDTDGDAPTPDTEEGIEPTAGSGRFTRLRRRPSITALVAAAVVLVLGVAVALNVVLLKDHRDHESAQDQRVAFIQAAKQGVVNMTTIDYTRAAQDVQRVIDGSTGSFRDEFSGRKASFVDVVQKSKVSTKGETGDAGIEKIQSDGSAVVLVSASSKVTNGAGAKDEARAWRLRVTVTPDNGQLKMSKVDFVP